MAHREGLLRPKFLITVLIIGIVLAVGAGLIVMRALDLNRYKDGISAYIKKETGREFVIGGQIDAYPSLKPTVVGTQITFGNASWGKSAHMLKVDRLSLTFDLFQLIFGNYEIEHATLSGGELYLETNPEGRGNWDISNADKVVDKAEDYIDEDEDSLESIRLTNMKVHYRNGRTGAVTSLVVETMGAAAGENTSVPAGEDVEIVDFDFKGAINGQRALLHGSTGSLAALIDGHPSRLSLDGEIGRAEIKIHGKAEDLLGLHGLDMSIEAGGPELADLTEPANLSMPDMGRFDLAATLAPAGKDGADLVLSASLEKSNIEVSINGRVGDLSDFDQLDIAIGLSAPEAADLGPFFGVKIGKVGSMALTGWLHRKSSELVIDKLDARLGDSDVKGTVKLHLGEKPKVTVALSSGVIDLSPFLGDAESAIETPSAKEGKDDRIFSDKPLPFDALHSVDAEIDLDINRLLIREARVDLVRAKVRLANGVLTVDPIKIDYRKTTATARLKIDAKKAPTVGVKVLVQNFDLGRLLKETHVTDLVSGDMDLGTDVTGHGNSARAIVGSLDGTVGFVMGSGTISSTYVDLIATDLTKYLMPGQKHEDETVIKCALGQFAIKNGVAKAQALLLDTKEMTMNGTGTIDFSTEQVDLRLSPRPKDVSLFSLATDLRLTGSLSQLKVAPDTLSLIESIAEGVAGVLLLGPAGLLVPFASLGAGHHHPCVDDLQKVFGKAVAKEIKASAD